MWAILFRLLYVNETEIKGTSNIYNLGQITTHKTPQKTTKTRTTRTPSFWGYPRHLMITHTIKSYWIPSQKKTQSKLQI